MARGATADQKDTETLVIVFPEGRVINNSLLVRDAFKSNAKAAPGKPYYRVETAYDPDELKVEGGVIDKVWEWAQGVFGENIYFDIDADDLKPEDKKGKIKVVTPFGNGDEMKAERERNGKVGDAYGGKIVVRAKTQFNRDGQDAEGGADVYNEAVEPITAVNRAELYNGMMAIMAVTPAEYEPNNGGVGITFYLKAVQKSGAGEKLASKADNSKLFAPLAKAGGETATAGARTGRAKRAG